MASKREIKQKDIDRILSGYFWPEHIDTRTPYTTTHDDNEGDPKSGYLTVMFSPDGDAWIETTKERRGQLRFRVPEQGGGKFPKIRNALLLLAEAIRQEGKEPYAN